VRKPSLTLSIDEAGATEKTGSSPSVQPDAVARDSTPPKEAVRPPFFIPWGARIVPFFLSAFLFLSGIFAIFSPLPLLILAYRSRRHWAWIAAVSNAAIVLVTSGTVSLGIYAVFVLSLALMLPEFLKHKRSLEASITMTLLAMFVSAGLWVAGYAQTKNINPVTEVKNQVTGLVEYLDRSLTLEVRENWMGDTDPEEWKQNLIVELPSAVCVFALMMTWINLVALLRLNPGHFRERLGIDAAYLKKWKAPEFLLWPTIISGLFLIIEAGRISDVSLNVFKFLMAIYAIQGLSILSFLFDVWNVRGVFRTLGFIAAVFLMLPLLLSLGFFDLWFDFRAKLRQS